ncbi:MAG: disulfide bond formation protein B [Gammaproteobacteria bacterium]|nr:disulfide bond formation protein B [Gammaproteobacteria bacterium]
MAKKLFRSPDRSYYRLSYLLWLAIIALIMVVIITAMYFQYFDSELPCPLCLCQRLCFLGVAYAAIMHFKGFNRLKYTGIGLLFTALLLAVSIKQSLLDICGTKGHAWVGSAFFGIHMPIWSFLISMFILLLLAFDLIFLTKNTNQNSDEYPDLKLCATILSWIIVGLCAINFISVFIQCGISACHTTGYTLLS